MRSYARARWSGPKKFRNEFDPAVLRFDSLVMRRFQNAAPGSREFKMRLVELVAAAIHQIAVILFQELKWVDMGHRNPVLFEYRDPHPTLFYHCKYMDHQQYPHGLADVAGYWAEDRILGGIVVFDRGKSGTECNDIYLHSAREQYTPHIWRLLDSQFDDFTEFLLSEQPSATPLPILPSEENEPRYDSWDAMTLHHIFRGPWERAIPSERPEDRDCVAVGD
ncbi:hypothetical protein VTI28DRAFT_3773 [Corynascus sepedonium]